MVTARAFSPGHITGFFFICEEESNPLWKGSMGAGFSISRGVETRVVLGPSSDNPERDRPAVPWGMYKNGCRQEDLEVSRKVVELFEQEGLLSRNKDGELSLLRIEHTIDIPEGAGFGSSGAGALSLSLALNHALGSPCSPTEAAAFAHRAEIACRTGLGTVIGEFHGGFEIRTAPGAPGYGTIKAIPQKKELYLLFMVFTGMATKEQLARSGGRERINQVGKELYARLMADPRTETFFSLSRTFSERVGIATPEVRRNFLRFDREGTASAMLMFGNGLYGVYEHREEAEEAEKRFRSLEPEAWLFITSPSAEGGRVIEPPLAERKREKEPGAHRSEVS